MACFRLPNLAKTNQEKGLLTSQQITDTRKPSHHNKHHYINLQVVFPISLSTNGLSPQYTLYCIHSILCTLPQMLGVCTLLANYKCPHNKTMSLHSSCQVELVKVYTQNTIQTINHLPVQCILLYGTHCIYTIVLPKTYWGMLLIKCSLQWCFSYRRNSLTKHNKNSYFTIYSDNLKLKLNFLMQ